MSKSPSGRSRRSVRLPVRIADLQSLSDLPRVLRRLMSAAEWCYVPGGCGLRVSADDLVVRGAARCGYTGGLGVRATAWVSGFAARALVLYAPLKVTVELSVRAGRALRALYGARVSYPVLYAQLDQLVAPILLETPQFVRAIVASALHGYAVYAAQATGTREDDWLEALAPLRECAPTVTWDPPPAGGSQ